MMITISPNLIPTTVDGSINSSTKLFWLFSEKQKQKSFFVKLQKMNPYLVFFAQKQTYLRWQSNQFQLWMWIQIDGLIQSTWNNKDFLLRFISSNYSNSASIWSPNQEK